ncbi:MAG: hypothetical protein JWO98_3108 [Frankiales bacterium]|nr:hypothetical protein [Frankiales bacterium]
MAAAGPPAGLTIAAGHHPLWTGFAAFLLLLGPALAAMALLPGAGVLGRATCLLAAGIVVDGVVAEAMLALHRWSISGGATAVGVISAAGWLLARPSAASAPRTATGPTDHVPPAAGGRRVT